MQLYLAIALPWLIRLGPDAVFGDWSQAQQLGAQMGGLGELGTFSLVLLLFFLSAIYPMLRWFAATHKIGKWRVFLAVTLAGLMGGIVQLLLLAPLFGWMEKSIGGFLDLF